MFFSILNEFLAIVEKSSPRNSLRVEFFKVVAVSRYTGFFSETGVLGMLEANDYDVLNNETTLLRVMLDVFL